MAGHLRKISSCSKSVTPFFNCFGGYVKSVTTYSYAASETIIPHVIGMSYRKFLDQHTDWNSVSKIQM